MAATKVYLTTNAKQVYIDAGAGVPIPYTATHLRIYPNYVDQTISIKDELFGTYAISKLIFSDFQDEAGGSLGATTKDVVDSLSLFIG